MYLAEWLVTPLVRRLRGLLGCGDREVSPGLKNRSLYAPQAPAVADGGASAGTLAEGGIRTELPFWVPKALYKRSQTLDNPGTDR
jgi:hypothetical protein